MVVWFRQIKVLGLPVQFIAVASISLLLVIYLSGWVALSRVEARAGVAELAKTGQDSAVETQFAQKKQAWETVALFACPLH